MLMAGVFDVLPGSKMYQRLEGYSPEKQKAMFSTMELFDKIVDGFVEKGMKLVPDDDEVIKSVVMFGLAEVIVSEELRKHFPKISDDYWEAISEWMAFRLRIRAGALVGTLIAADEPH